MSGAEGTGAPRRGASLALIRLGIVGGLFTCLGYPLAAFAPLPPRVAIVLAALIGPSLGVGSLGLREALELHRASAPARVAALLNLLAGALLTAMLLVQVAVRRYAVGEDLPRKLVGVWLGLDVAWDVYVGLGTILFSVAMLRHPRFGRAFAFPGLVVATALLVLNLATFPVPPAESGLVDVGPLVGLWYLAVTLRIWRSLPWAERLAAGDR